MSRRRRVAGVASIAVGSVRCGCRSSPASWPRSVPRSPAGPWTEPHQWTTATPSGRPCGWSISAEVRSPATVAVRRSRWRPLGRLPRLRERPAPHRARGVRRGSRCPPFRGEAYASRRLRRDSQRSGRSDAVGDVVDRVTDEISLARGCAPWWRCCWVGWRLSTAQAPGNTTLRYGTSTTPGKSGTKSRSADPGSST